MASLLGPSQFCPKMESLCQGFEPFLCSAFSSRSHPKAYNFTPNLAAGSFASKQRVLAPPLAL